MNHKIKIGDKIRILKHEANYTTEKIGTILTVKEILDTYGYDIENGSFHTDQSDEPFNTWYFDNSNFFKGEIEIVEENRCKHGVYGNDCFECYPESINLTRNNDGDSYVTSVNNVTPTMLSKNTKAGPPWTVQPEEKTIQDYLVELSDRITTVEKNINNRKEIEELKSKLKAAISFVKFVDEHTIDHAGVHGNHRLWLKCKEVMEILK